MKKFCDYSVDTDVTDIYCNLENCKLSIAPTEENILSARFTQGAKIDIANNSTDLVIRQKTLLKERLWGKTPSIELKIPAHLVVNLHIDGKRANVAVNGGIYGETEIRVACGNLDLNGIAAESVNVRSDAMQVKISESTVKGNLLASVECGNVTVENCFAAHLNGKIKCGNAGAANLNCRDSIFEVACGNVNATVLGDENYFDLALNTKTGTCNKESTIAECARGAFKAFTECGNIHVEFIRPENYSQPEQEATI